ncbi:hypothetical protein Dacet_2184 [Denitrovibrio acetiphilus DSM 12809]|uniref:Transporter n=1 Tax=Denitrovibrio acetiphilus (strain DSM 12809 / NBRC 114555 / N2460) TaxID=522772 RepID=D4H2F5_DENA2|nr:hypothetical protein [Denitrovibrio acetiphilus]ADD68946.1 hypothetical protein Dacet_2184 [Denitrovibrio acetiphilus DSM 12809]
MKKGLTCIFLAVFALSANAKEIDKSMIPVGAVNMSNGVVFAKGEFGIITKNHYTVKDEIYSGTDEADFNPAMGSSQVKKLTVNMTQVALRYGIGNGFDIRLIVPYISKELEAGAGTPGGIMKKKFDTSGLGDLKLLSRYQIMNQMKGAPFFLQAGLGLKLPTGESEEKKDGTYMPMGVQSGSGSTDYLAEAGLTKLLGRHRLDMYLLYMYTTEGSQDFEFGNVFQYNLGYNFSLTKFFDLELEFNGKTQAKNKQNGKSIDASGGTFYALTPGFHIRKGQQIHFSLGVPYTIYRDVNGTQPTEDLSLVARFTVRF